MEEISSQNARSIIFSSEEITIFRSIAFSKKKYFQENK